jgi:hypothetical protein
MTITDRNAGYAGRKLGEANFQSYVAMCFAVFDPQVTLEIIWAAHCSNTTALVKRLALDYSPFGNCDPLFKHIANGYAPKKVLFAPRVEKTGLGSAG